MLRELKWDPELNLGLDLIDVQHKNLVDIINELVNCLNEKHLPRSSITIIQALIDYANYHFEFEEEYAKEMGFELSEVHLIEHKEFVEKIVEIRDRMDSDRDKILIELILYLKGWLYMHLQGSDKKLFSIK
jgi:hemerythrin